MKKALILAIGLVLFGTGCQSKLYSRKYQIIDSTVLYSEDVTRRFGDAKEMATQMGDSCIQGEVACFILANGGPWANGAGGVSVDTNTLVVYVWNTKTNLDAFEALIAPLEESFIKRIPGEMRGAWSDW